jgi:type I restriction enzyme S subunit
MTNLPPGWRAAALGDVCEVVSGATPKTGVPKYWGGDVRWVTPNDMSRDHSQTLMGGERTLTRAGLSSCSARLFPAGSVIVSSRAPVGYVAIAGVEMCTNQGCKTAVPPPEIDSKYLYWYLTYAKPDLEARASGTTFKEISAKRFAETEFRWPGLEEQQRIVTILEDHLSRVDSAEHGLRASVQRSRQLRRSSLQAAVAAARSAGAWTTTLGDIADVGTGATPRKSRRDFYEDGTVPWVTSADLVTGVVDQPRQFITERAVHETSVKWIEPGAILVAMYGEGRTRGASALLGFRATTNQACATVQLHKEYSHLRDWVLLVLTAKYSEMRRMAAGGVQPNLNLGLVRSIPVPVPTEDLGKELIARTNDILAAGERLQMDVRTAIDRAAVLRRSLLESAFSGSLTPGADQVDQPERPARV